jgi:predicted DNA-binding protein
MCSAFVDEPVREGSRPHLVPQGATRALPMLSARIRAKGGRRTAASTGASDRCGLFVYVSSAKTTTVRVPTKPRDRLKALAAQRGESASEVVAEFVDDASEETMLAEAGAAFETLAKDPEALAAYHSEAREIEAAFGAPTPEW